MQFEKSISRYSNNHFVLDIFKFSTIVTLNNCFNIKEYNIFLNYFGSGQIEFKTLKEAKTAIDNAYYNTGITKQALSFNYIIWSLKSNKKIIITKKNKNNWEMRLLGYGCVATGKTRKEAFNNLKEFSREHLDKETYQVNFEDNYYA